MIGKQAGNMAVKRGNDALSKQIRGGAVYLKQACLPSSSAVAADDGSRIQTTCERRIRGTRGINVQVHWLGCLAVLS